MTTRGEASGRLFVDDAMGRLTMHGPASVWARRINTEYTTPEVLNQGGRPHVRKQSKCRQEPRCCGQSRPESRGASTYFRLRVYSRE